MIGLAVTFAFSLVAFTMPTSVWAAGPTLTVSADGGVHTFDRDELLARTDVAEITTSRDVAYRTPRTYRAVALAKVLEGVVIPPDAVVEVAAQDGFVTQLPRDLVYANGGIVAYMAIEVADTPWPPLLYRMARRPSVIRPNHEMALPSCQFVGARRASQAVALACG
jgi:hypothetical protein